MEFVRFSVNCDWKEQVVGTVHGGSMIIHFNRQIISSFLHIEGIPLDTGEVVGRVNTWV